MPNHPKPEGTREERHVKKNRADNTNVSSTNLAPRPPRVPDPKPEGAREGHRAMKNSVDNTNLPSTNATWLPGL